MQKLKVSNLKKVESSNLEMVGFDGEKIFVKFKNGKLYEYPNTTKEDFDSLIDAESVGKEFFKSFKKREEYKLLENTVLEKKGGKPKTKLTEETVRLATKQYIGSKGFTEADADAIVRNMTVTLGEVNKELIAKLVKEQLKG